MSVWGGVKAGGVLTVGLKVRVTCLWKPLEVKETCGSVKSYWERDSVEWSIRT